MESNKYTEYKLVDSLTTNNTRFALYRLPSEKEIHLVFQHSPEAVLFNNLIELNEQSGFVINPFRISATTPIALIKADITKVGEEAIFQFIKSLTNEETHISEVYEVKDSANIFEAYQLAFTKFSEALKTDKCQKLVLSRTSQKTPSADFSAGISFKNACEKYPDDFIYLAHTPETGTWLGCSPELLVSGQGNKYQTVALAGTKDETNNGEWDEKNRIEQQIVVDYMQQQLQLDNRNITQQGPFTAQAGNLRHLKTEFTFEVENPNRIGNLLQLLHPSPAVCGFPKQEAFDFITHNEGYDRQYYSGFLGCLNLNNRTDLYVNLRCMKIENTSLRLYAGGGLLSSSELKSEWNETEAKLQTILSII